MKKHLNQSILQNPMFFFLMVLIIGQAAGFQAWRTMFNNFAVDTINLNGLQVGVIQSFREIPGFLAFTVIFCLLLIKESFFAALMVILLGVGVSITGLFPSYQGLILTTLFMSIAFHFFETTNQSLTLQSFSTLDAPIAISWFKSIGAITNILVGILIFTLTRFAYFSMPVLYLVFGISIALMVIILLVRKRVPQPGVPQKLRIVLKKKYWLFYTLNFLSGARRQIFVVFAVFMLVKKYTFSIEEIAVLFIVNNLITWRLSPYIGKWINRFGERKMLSVEYVSLILIFLGYAFLENKYIVASLYILDHVFFSFAISINTYFQKKAEPQDIAPSMATGFTINHITAVIIPVVGGFLWMQNWRIPFLAGACVALISLFFAQKINTHKTN